MDIKRILTASLLMVSAVGATFALPFDKYTIDRSELPETAQTFLTEYFPKGKIGMIKVDKHLLKKTDYDVRLVNGTTVEFSNAGKWTSVDCKNSAVPEALVPKTIRRYVEKNFPDVKITKIVKKSLGYELRLSDGVEVKFDLLGTFKGVKMDE